MASIEQKFDKLLLRISGNIKRIRKAKGMPQRKMEEFGFDLRNYQRLEAGKHSPSLFTLHKLANAWKIDISEFFA